MESSPILKTPLNNAQLEILKLFARDLEETDLKEIKRLIVRYLGDKLVSTQYLNKNRIN